MVRCAIWYHLYNVKNVKNTHGRVLLVVKMQADGQTQAICQLLPTNCLSVFRRGYTEIFVSDYFMKHSLMYITFNLISWNSYKICKKETSTIKKKKEFKRSLEPATLLKERLWRRCFPVNLAKFLKTHFLRNTSGRLLLQDRQEKRLLLLLLILLKRNRFAES